MSTLNQQHHIILFVCFFCFTYMFFLTVYFCIKGGTLLIWLCTISDKCWTYANKKWFLFMMCQITVLRVDLLGCIQPLIWLNLNGIKCLLVGPWLAYYISHFNENIHMQIWFVWSEDKCDYHDWWRLLIRVLQTETLKKEEAIWTGICNPMNYLVHIIHKSLWREDFMRF